MSLSYGPRYRFREDPVGQNLGIQGLATGILRIFYGDVEYVPWRGGIPFSQINRPRKVERTWDQKNPGPPFLQGGPFLSTKFRNPFWELKGVGSYSTDPDQIGGSPFINYKYDGGFAEPEFFGDSDTNFYASVGTPGTSSTLIPDISNLGPSAYNKLKPKLEQAGAAQFLAEARDVPRMLKQTSKFFHDAWKGSGGSGRHPFMSPKRASDDFLNLQFGWMPFIKDMRDLSRTYAMSKEYVSRITRDNDRWIKRSRVLADQQSSTTLYAANNASAFNPVLGETMGRMMKNRPGLGGVPCKSYTITASEDFTHVWSEGKFKYYRPEFDASMADYDSPWKAAQRQMTLYGANINPSVLYKITPWSWLVDWFTNVGDNIDNANSWANDGSVAKYLYVMAHSTRVVTQTTVFHFWDKGDVTCKWYRNFDSKQRVEAGPYGLGWSEAGLSLRQLAILGALSISKGT